MNKIVLLSGLFTCLSIIGVAQITKISVLNDTTELQEYSNGEKLKMHYKLNGKIITLKEKDKLVTDHPSIQQEFNIRNVNDEIIGEINFIDDTIIIEPVKKEIVEDFLASKLDISQSLNDRQFPDFSWLDINGNRISLDQLRGKTIVLNFWHTSCVPCIAEMPLLNKLVEKYNKQDVVFISATPNTEEELKEFMIKRKFDYLQVPNVDTKTIFFPLPGWPIHVVLNNTGKIGFYALGKQNNIEEKLVESIERSVGKKN